MKMTKNTKNLKKVGSFVSQSIVENMTKSAKAEEVIGIDMLTTQREPDMINMMEKDSHWHLMTPEYQVATSKVATTPPMVNSVWMTKFSVAHQLQLITSYHGLSRSKAIVEGVILPLRTLNALWRTYLRPEWKKRLTNHSWKCWQSGFRMKMKEEFDSLTFKQCLRIIVRRLTLIFPTRVVACPYSMLGLGDIVIPALLLRFDVSRGSKSNYFKSAFSGYAVGVILTIVVMNRFQAAQVDSEGFQIHLLPHSSSVTFYTTITRCPGSPTTINTTT
ncbi:signal peptide peptidase 1 [Artemisia annua]|uniref:Signal peptide peptidase 1 n=1 Tax=Artemisia annua TaxID=35608 RepID=A0A2U1PH04_ARTAN|nr:signal peptide peptidase 1 [Artemisia annua]